MVTRMSVAALVLAAGRGERFRSPLPKAFVLLAGRPLLWHALAAVAAAREIDLVVPVVAPGDMERFAALAPLLRDIKKLAPAVAGGRERQDSMQAGLRALPPEVAWVAVHDAARPLIRQEEISRVVTQAQRCGAALLAVPAMDTVKRVIEGRVVETPPRAQCWLAQTPQVFRVELLREALAKAMAEGWVATDDAQLVERLGSIVEVVPGASDNLKITQPEDLLWAEARLAARAQAPSDT